MRRSSSARAPRRPTRRSGSTTRCGSTASTSERLVAVVGPTGVGKTPLAVAVARRLGRAELVNADSRQVIRGLHVGTCAPTAEQLGGVPCHLLELRDPGEPFSVADWLRCAESAVDSLAARGVQPVVVGGTGLYVIALLNGLALDGGAPEPARRRERDALSESPEGLHQLVAELLARDPEGAATIDQRNRRRVVRALELVDARGSVGAARTRGPARAAVVIGLDAAPELHRRLVAERAARMLSGPLQEEVDAALARGVSEHALDACGIGYREALAVRAETSTVGEALVELTRRTLRYARAQRTWFRRDPRVRWVQRDDGPVDALVDTVLSEMRR